MGLQGQLVGNVFEGTNGLTDSYIMDEAWLAATLGKTTVKIGRMELDTPIVFTEKWSIAKNTFEAAVVINQDLPDTTLVGAYVGGTNGQHLGATAGTLVNGASIGTNNVVQGVSNGSTFTQFYNGAYAVAAINNSFKPLVAQAWYYNASTNVPVAGTTLNGVESYWLQGDVNMNGIMAGVQYNDIDYQTQGAGVINSDALAVMLGYKMEGMFTAKVSYSEINKNFAAGFNLAGTQSKLYTEAWWNYGKIIQADTQSYNVTVTSPVNGLFDLGLYYTDADQSATAGNNDMTELTVTASKNVGQLNVTLAYINADVKTPLVANDDETSNTIQAYLTLNF